MYTALVIGLAGLSIWGICSQLELQSDRTNDVFFASRHKAPEEMTRAVRPSRDHEYSLAQRSIRFFKSIGVGLAVIGLGGALVLVQVAFAVSRVRIPPYPPLSQSRTVPATLLGRPTRNCRSLSGDSS